MQMSLIRASRQLIQEIKKIIVNVLLICPSSPMYLKCEVSDISHISRGGYGELNYFRAVNAYIKIVPERGISEACVNEDVWKSGHIILYS